MERTTDLLLRVGLMLSAFAALIQLVQMVLGVFIRVQWYWGGSFAFFLAPLAFALTIYVRELTRTPRGSEPASTFNA